jgi:hypothetical protein
MVKKTCIYSILSLQIQSKTYLKPLTRNVAATAGVVPQNAHGFAIPAELQNGTLLHACVNGGANVGI